MATRTILSRLGRALIALPFLAISHYALREMDGATLQANQQLSLKKGKIEWEGGSVAIPSSFFGIPTLDQVFAGISVTFSPSAFGYDGVAWWQMLSFLTDLGPMYVMWYLESSRKANQGRWWSPVYFPTLWTHTAQFMGIGILGPLFYLLSFVFGPTAAQVTRTVESRTIRPEYYTLLFPIILVLHNLEVFIAYLHPSFETRNYWVWAWQLSPLWVGIANFVAAKTIGRGSGRSSRKNSSSPPNTGSIEKLLLGVGLISAGVWISLLVYAPYSLSEIFIPVRERQTDLILHARRALQIDQLFSFGASFLWLVYSVAELQWTGGAAGKVPGGVFAIMALLPVLTVAFGPGVALLAGWYARELMIMGAKTTAVRSVKS